MLVSDSAASERSLTVQESRSVGDNGAVEAMMLLGVGTRRGSQLVELTQGPAASIVGVIATGVVLRTLSV